MFLFQLWVRHGIINPETGFSCFLQLVFFWCHEQPHASQLMKGERCTIERPLFVSSANFQLINICLHRIKKVRIYLHTLTSQQKIHWYRVEYITLFCNGFTDARATPKRKAVCSNHIGDASLKNAKVIFPWERRSSHFLFWSEHVFFHRLLPTTGTFFKTSTFPAKSGTATPHRHYAAF